MKTNATAKIFAGIALFGIIIGIVGTAILFIIQGGATIQQPVQQLTEEEIQKIIEESNINFDQTGSGEIPSENNDVEVIPTEEEIQESESQE